MSVASSSDQLEHGGAHLHGLSTGGTELAGDDNLASLGAGLHDEAEDTVAGTADGESAEELVAEGLGLSDGGKSTVLDLLGVELEGVLGELEADTSASSRRRQ